MDKLEWNGVIVATAKAIGEMAGRSDNFVWGKMDSYKKRYGSLTENTDYFILKKADSEMLGLNASKVWTKEGCLKLLKVTPEKDKAMFSKLIENYFGSNESSNESSGEAVNQEDSYEMIPLLDETKPQNTDVLATKAELTLTITNGVETIDSREVAEVIGKPHNDLMKDIRRYSVFLNEGKISHVDFFIESTYQDSKGETRPCYLITKKGCEMIANKMTGQKGIIFTALYINAFHSMKQELNQQSANVNVPEHDIDKEMRLKELELEKMKIQLKEKELLAEAENQKMKLLASLSAISDLNDAQKGQLFAMTAELFGMANHTARQTAEQGKLYSATEAGEIIGISAALVGSYANQFGIKHSEYGAYLIIRDKTGSERQAFHYNCNGIDRLREIASMKQTKPQQKETKPQQKNPSGIDWEKFMMGANKAN